MREYEHLLLVSRGPPIFDWRAKTTGLDIRHIIALTCYRTNLFKPFALIVHVQDSGDTVLDSCFEELDIAETCTWASIKPGNNVQPVASMTAQSAGGDIGS